MGLRFHAHAFWGVPIPTNALSERAVREWLGAPEGTHWDALEDRALNDKGIYLVKVGDFVVIAPLRPRTVSQESAAAQRLREPDAAAVMALGDTLRALGLWEHRREVGWYLLPEVS